MPPIRAIFDVHFEASVNEQAIRPDLDFLRPARRAVAAGAWGRHLRSPEAEPIEDFESSPLWDRMMAPPAKWKG
jgi:hypothetical protein